MDVSWFATDQDNNIAVFDAGDIGAIPTVAKGAQSFVWCGVLDQLAVSLNLPQCGDDNEKAFSDERLEQLGVFLFHADEKREPYEKEFGPTSPRKMDYLPIPMQELFASVRLIDIKFESSDQVFPERYFECLQTAR
jgi:hypothetical protein